MTKDDVSTLLRAPPTGGRLEERGVSATLASTRALASRQRQGLPSPPVDTDARSVIRRGLSDFNGRIATEK
jgi:hypothetical protein